MKAHLLFRDADFDPEQKLPWNAEALTEDLELNTLFKAMARDDAFIFQVCRAVVLSSMGNDVEAILYRQATLQDCLENREIIATIYAMTIDAVERVKKTRWSFFSDYPAAILSRSIAIIQSLLELLRNLRRMAEEDSPRFKSEGFAQFWSTLRAELNDEYFGIIEGHLHRLKFRHGVLISADVGKGTKGVNYVLRKPPDLGKWFERIFARKPESYTYYLPPRDDAGGREMSDMRDRGLTLVANALAQSSDHILSFFHMLRIESAFYIGCANLHETLLRKGAVVALPKPIALVKREFRCRKLYDVSLALSIDGPVVGNDLAADDKALVVITGANRGGKSTFLRAVGLAQLMLQSGMFAPAEALSANVCDGIFTHYKREEDTTMKSGKLDEELSRMSIIADHLTENPLLLFNESFAATTEREGSEIARQVVHALLDRRHKVFFVTHLSDFAMSMYERHSRDAVFLRAERGAEGERPFKLVEGQPLDTSYGADLYRTIFKDRGGAPAVAAGKGLGAGASLTPRRASVQRSEPDGSARLAR